MGKGVTLKYSRPKNFLQTPRPSISTGGGVSVRTAKDYEQASEKKLRRKLNKSLSHFRKGGGRAHRTDKTREPNNQRGKILRRKLKGNSKVKLLGRLEKVQRLNGEGGTVARTKATEGSEGDCS